MANKPLSLKSVPFAEALVAARSRGVVLPAEYYGVMQGIERATAFSVANVAALDQLQQTLDSLNTALDQGMTFDQWKNEVLAAPEVLALPQHRLDNIFRTNLQGAYARGRCQQIEANKEQRPFLMYSATNDSRVRPHHLAMDGFIGDVDSEIWKKWMPPAGYRCRCTVIALTEEQAAARRTKDQVKLEEDTELLEARYGALMNGPDDGWDYSPCDANPADWVKQKAVGYDPALAVEARAIPDEAEILRDQWNPAKWEKISGAKGSNKGGVYEAPDGTRFYVKQYADPDQARTEFATNKINNLMGIDTPESYLLDMNGDLVIANKWRDDFTAATVGKLQQSKYKVDIRRVYQAAALTKNWDVVGLDFDNLVINGKGRLAIVDSGGSLKFRAQGGPKPFEAGPIEELDSLLSYSYNRQAAEVFGKYTKEQLLVGVQNNLGEITKTKLANIFHEAGFAPAEAKYLTDTTWARVKWMRELGARRKTRTRTKNPVQATVFRDTPEITPDAAFKRAKTISRSTAEAGYRKARRLGMSDAQAKDAGTLTVYTGGSYRRINRVLRGKDSPSPSVLNYSNAAVSAMSRFEKYTGAVTRGLDLFPDGQDDWLKRMTAAKAKGEAIEFKSFVSTDTKGGWEADTKIHINATGFQGVDVDRFSANQGEKEILFPRGARFKLDRIEFGEPMWDGRRPMHVYLEEVPEAFEGKAVTFSLPDQSPQ